jgi:hypothetical protein
MYFFAASEQFPRPAKIHRLEPCYVFRASSLAMPPERSTPRENLSMKLQTTTLPRPEAIARPLNFGRSQTLACAVAAALLLTLAQIALANKKSSSLPDAVFTARTLYIDNQASDASLQNSAYMALAKWGHFQIVDDASKADVVLRLTGSAYVKSIPSDTPPDMSMKPSAPTSSASLLPNGAASAPDGFTRLTLLDAKTSGVLWSDLSKTNRSDAALHMLDGLRDAYTQGRKDRGK